MSELHSEIKRVGGVTKVAEMIGKPLGTVSSWLSRRVPAEEVLAFEAATGISRHVIRPDVFGEAKPADARAAVD